jgi:hypothetical protein
MMPNDDRHIITDVNIVVCIFDLARNSIAFLGRFNLTFLRNIRESSLSAAIFRYESANPPVRRAVVDFFLFTVSLFLLQTIDTDQNGPLS